MLENFRDYPIIGRLEEKDAADILSCLREEEYADGDILLRQGQVSGRFHIILSGTLDVCLENGVRVSVAKLERGQFCGEMSCLTGEPVSATVRAEGAVRTVSMPREGILRLMDRSESFRQQMIESMIERIGKSNERVQEERARSLVVARQLELERQSSFGPLVGSSAFMGELRERIERLADRSEPLVIVGEPGVGKFHVACELHRLSERSRHPLLRVDGAGFDRDEWEMKARASQDGAIIVQHADRLPPDTLRSLAETAGRARVIMTAEATLPVEAGTIHVIPLRERTEDIPELVCEFAKASALPPEEAVSQEAMRMIALFPFLRGNISELKQVVQDALVLSGGKPVLIKHLRFGAARRPGSRPTVGLALGSGSVRGAAHVGVLKVLEEADIPIDLIAGTSVGAFLGALYAGGQPVSAFERVLPTVRWRQLVRPSLSAAAFVDNRPMIRFIEHYIGPVHFENMALPFAAVASDVVTGEACILNKGRVSHAICASTAIPGIMKPVSYRNRKLADGAIVHPVPVALAKSMGADIVVAIDVSQPAAARGVPGNFVSSILNIIDIMSDKLVQEELQMADVVLSPRLGANPFTFKASTAFIRKGEQVAREALAEIKDRIAAAMVGSS